MHSKFQSTRDASLCGVVASHRCRVSTWQIILAIVFAGLLTSPDAHASEIEVLKQKGCTLLLSPGSDFSKGQLVKAETSSGKALTFRVTALKGQKAFAKMTARAGRCISVGGQTLSLDGKTTRRKTKLSFGVMGSGGQFTFRQPFVPSDLEADSSPETQKAQTVNGLSGLGFSAGGLLRYEFKTPFAVELGVGALSSTTTGKTKLVNGDDYQVEGKFLEVMLQPALAITSCISARLFCKAGGVFAIPIKSTISVKTNILAETAALKYTRMGGEFAAGINIGRNLTILGGTQISQDKGSFKFDSSIDAVSIGVLTVYIFGGVAAVF